MCIYGKCCFAVQSKRLIMYFLTYNFMCYLLLMLIVYLHTVFKYCFEVTIFVKCRQIQAPKGVSCWLFSCIVIKKKIIIIKNKNKKIVKKWRPTLNGVYAAQERRNVKEWWRVQVDWRENQQHKNTVKQQRKFGEWKLDEGKNINEKRLRQINEK